MANTIRAKVDNELLRRVGTWFTVRELQETLRVKQATLKPLIMKYAREELLKRRSIRGTARSVEFSPVIKNARQFREMLLNLMPYRGVKTTTRKATKTVRTPKAMKLAATKTRKSRTATKTTAKRATKSTTRSKTTARRKK